MNCGVALPLSPLQDALDEQVSMAEIVSGDDDEKIADIHVDRIRLRAIAFPADLDFFDQENAEKAPSIRSLLSREMIGLV